MKRTLSQKYLLVYALMALLAFLLISTLGAHLLDRQLIRQTASSLYRSATEISGQQSALTSSSGLTLEDQYNRLKPVADLQQSEIWLLSTSGQILLNTADSTSVDRATGTDTSAAAASSASNAGSSDSTASDLSASDAATTEAEDSLWSEASAQGADQLEDFDPLALGSSYYSTGDFFHYFSEDTLSVLPPVTRDLRLCGYVAIHVPLSTVLSDREGILKQIHILFIILGIILLAMLVLLLFFVNRPLHKIIIGAKEYASGNLAYRIRVHSRDELGYLADTLNYMSEEIGKSGEYQRKFIANVSHDFRSPLTSIKGYVEAILDGTIPPEMQERYLKIVLTETDRLNKLTREMLTQSNLDNQGFYLTRSNFDINAALRDTAAAFGGICIEKRIHLELLLTGETLMVNADFARIQQVLYNLLDNAIKFSPVDSVIQLETAVRHSKVHISVRDHGCGIPKESLQKIWERFYKTDSSRGKDKKGTGLGLSIVKEIINAHGQKIDVISTEGAGTEFTFTLQRCQL